MPRRKRPVLGVDYIIDPDGSAQFTREYLMKRGDCCENACHYCPYPTAPKASDHLKTTEVIQNGVNFGAAPRPAASV